MKEAIIIIAFAICCVRLGYLLGRDNGECKGRDTEWCRQYFERLEKEKARRRKNGQFKSHEEISSP